MSAYGPRSENRSFEKSSPESVAAGTAQARARAIEMADAFMVNAIPNVDFRYQVWIGWER